MITMSAYVGNLKRLGLANHNYREVIHTGPHSQLLVMALPAGVGVGDETHTVDQFIYVIDGEGEVELDGTWHPANRHTGIFIPAGTRHNVRNASTSTPLKFFVVSAPAHHPPRTVHRTKHDAIQAAIGGTPDS